MMTKLLSIDDLCSFDFGEPDYLLNGFDDEMDFIESIDFNISADMIAYEQPAIQECSRKSSEQDTKSKKRRVSRTQSNTKDSADSKSMAMVKSKEETTTPPQDTLAVIKAIFHRDVRRAYPKLLADAFNTSNTNHMKNVINLMATKDCRLVEFYGRDENSTSLPDRYVVGRSSVYQYKAATLAAFPDCVYDIQDFKLRQISHVPRRFDNTAVSLIFDGDTDVLDNYLLSIAQRDNEDPTRGFVICGKYTFIGTKVLDIVINQSEEDRQKCLNSRFTSTSPFDDRSDDTAVITLVPAAGIEFMLKPNILCIGIFIWVMNSDNKVSRFEYHANIE